MFAVDPKDTMPDEHTLPPGWLPNLNIPNDHKVLGIVETDPTTILFPIDTGEIVGLVYFKGSQLYGPYIYPGRVKVLERGKATRYKTALEVFDAMERAQDEYQPTGADPEDSIIDFL